MTLVKICGLTRRDDARYAVEAGADALGFVFAPGSRRRADPAVVAGIVAGLPSHVTTVGVFQDQPLDVVRNTMLDCGLDVAQLHGAEDAAYMKSLSLPVLKAVGLLGPDDVATLGGFGTLSVLLFDSARVELTSSGERRVVSGGTGTTFDWNWISSAHGLPRVVLSGGLDPENVAEAVRAARPWAVDVASGVEGRPGLKDPVRMRSFIAHAKRDAVASSGRGVSPEAGRAATLDVAVEWGHIFGALASARDHTVGGGRIGRLGAALRARRATGGKSVVPFFVGGYPDRETFVALLLAAERAGVDAIEVGLPSPDPALDGPVIRHAINESLTRGATPRKVLADVARARTRGLTVPVVLMAYRDHFLRSGGVSLATDAHRSGIDGLLIVDLARPGEDNLQLDLNGSPLETVVLLGPDTLPSRCEALVKEARGFVYCVSVEGGTGGSAASVSRARTLVDFVRRHSDIPVLVGFGITGPDAAREIAAVADGVIVGTAILTRMGGARGATAVRTAERFLGEIKDGIGGSHNGTLDSTSPSERVVGSHGSAQA